MLNVNARPKDFRILRLRLMLSILVLELRQHRLRCKG